MMSMCSECYIWSLVSYRSYLTRCQQVVTPQKRKVRFSPTPSRTYGRTMRTAWTLTQTGKRAWNDGSTDEWNTPVDYIIHSSSL